MSILPNSPRQTAASVHAPTVPTQIIDDSDSPGTHTQPQPQQQQQDNSTEEMIEKISNLQDLENQKYNDLNVLLASNPTPDNIAQQKVLINDITQLTQIRSSLFDTLLLHAQNNVKMNDTMNASVKDKHTIVTLKENDLSARKAAIAALNQETENTQRMVDINVYYKKQYEARVIIMKYIVLLCFLVIFFIVLMNLGWLPQEMVIVLVVMIIFVGGLYIGSLVYDAYKRSNMNYDEYSWGFNSQQMDSTISKQPKHKKPRSNDRTCNSGNSDSGNGDSGNGDSGNGDSGNGDGMSSSAASIEDSMSKKATLLMNDGSGDGSGSGSKVSESFMLSKVHKKYFSEPEPKGQGQGQGQGLLPFTMEDNYGKI